MKLVGLGSIVPPSSAQLLEWECPEGVSGDLIRVTFPSVYSINFIVLRFDWLRPNGDIVKLVDSEEISTPSTSASYLPMWKGGIDATSFAEILEKGIDWHIEPKDKIQFQVLNWTGANQTFQMGFALGERAVATDGRWWADEHGKLVRALTFIEEGLRTGARIGGLVVVDPDTYEGFDSE